MNYIAKVIRNVSANTQRLQLTYSIGSFRGQNARYNEFGDEDSESKTIINDSDIVVVSNVNGMGS